MPSGEALILSLWYTYKPFYSNIFYQSIFKTSIFDVDMFICGNFVRRETPLNRGFFECNTLAERTKSVFRRKAATHRQKKSDRQARYCLVTDVFTLLQAFLPCYEYDCVYLNHIQISANPTNPQRYAIEKTRLTSNQHHKQHPFL